MRLLYKKLNGTLPNNSTQTRKLLQGIIACVEDEEKAKKIIGPLYSLNDLRICFAHLLPQENIEQRKQNILSTFGLTDFQDYGATNFEDVRCISLVSVFSRLKEESNWTLVDAEPYIESLIAFYQDHHQTTFRVMEASEVRRLQRIPCRQVLQEIFDGKYYKWKSRQGKLNRYEQDRILLTQLLHEEHELHPCGMGGEKRLRKPVYLLRNETMPQKQCANTQKINKNLVNI